MGDPEARARYDTLTVETPTLEQETAVSEAAPDPIVCSVCGKVTAQPRYVIYFEVKSFFVVTYRSPIQGIFCSRCAEKQVLRATLVTWVLGWWGFPWGPIYSVHALFRNLLGGIRPRDVNARLAAYQAWVFARLGQRALARAVATDALGLAERTQRDDKGLELRRSLHALLVALDDGGPVRHLREGWSVSNRSGVIQAAIILLAAVAIVGVAGYEPSVNQPVKVAPATPSQPVTPPLARPLTPPPPTPTPVPSFVEPIQPLPANGTSRRYWTRSEEELLAPLRIVTAGGSPNYFIKVVDWERGTPILTVFVRSGQTVNVKVPLGSYRLKYASGTEWYGEKHLFGPETAYSRAQDRFDFAVAGSQVSGYTVELIKQVGGNLKTAAIRPEDF